MTLKNYLIAAFAGFVAAAGPWLLCLQKSATECTTGIGILYQFEMLPFGTLLTRVVFGIDDFFAEHFNLVEHVYTLTDKEQQLFGGQFAVGDVYFIPQYLLQGPYQIWLLAFITFVNVACLVFLWQIFLLRRKKTQFDTSAHN